MSFFPKTPPYLYAGKVLSSAGKGERGGKSVVFGNTFVPEKRRVFCVRSGEGKRRGEKKIARLLFVTDKEEECRHERRKEIPVVKGVTFSAGSPSMYCGKEEDRWSEKKKKERDDVERRSFRPTRRVVQRRGEAYRRC